MARRATGRGGGGWWMVALLIACAFLAWWVSARRAEAPGPPSSVPGARMLGEAPPVAGEAPAGDGEEITQPEKHELERVLRERGSAGGE